MENPKKLLVDRILHFRRHRKLFKDFTVNISSNTQSKSQIDEESKRKGDEFEKFVVKRFDPLYFTLIEWRSDKAVDNIFPLMSKFPDLEFFYQSEYEEKFIAVECKWREHFKREKIWLDKFHLENYRHYESVTGIDTFLVLGVGNTPSFPNKVYAIPLKEISHETLHEFELGIHHRKNPHHNFFLNCSLGRLQ
jgi:hypothetical protein